MTPPWLTLTAWPESLAGFVFFTGCVLWILVRRWREDRPGWLILTPRLRRTGRQLLRAGWLAAGLASLLLLFLWPAHPAAEVVAGPDRQADVIRMYNTVEYLDWWQNYVIYGTIAEPLLLWLWGGWLAVAAGLRLLFGLSTAG